MANTKNQTPVTFEAPEGFADMPLAAATKAVVAWVVANPNVVIKPTEALAEGNLPPYIRKPTGKRATINYALNAPEGITVRDFLQVATMHGGGYTDLVAALQGGYSPSSKVWGKAYVTLQA